MTKVTFLFRFDTFLKQLSVNYMYEFTCNVAKNVLNLFFIIDLKKKISNRKFNFCDEELIRVIVNSIFFVLTSV